MLRRAALVSAVAVMATAGDLQGADQTLTAGRGAPSDSARALAGKTGPMSRIGTALANLYTDHAAYREAAGDRATPQGSAFEARDPLIHMVDDMVTIDAAATDVDGLVSDLRALGAVGVSSYGRMVSARVPVDELDRVAALDGLRFARPAMATRSTGRVTSNGDRAIQADRARRAEGVRGRRVTVGTLSDSFDCLGGADDDIDSDDLPRRLTILDDSACPASDEGRAMMQIIHDVAPRARQAFHTAFNGQADFANGIIELEREADADIIVDDVIYFAEPMFQDGIIAQAVDRVRARGAVYFSAAGNNARDAWDSGKRRFAYSGVRGIFGGLRHDFDSRRSRVNDLQRLRLGPGVTIFVFQWDEPFFSVSGAPGSASDMDIVLYSSSGAFTGFGGFDANIGGDPVEVFAVSTSARTVVNVGLELMQGPRPTRMKYVMFAQSPPKVLEFPTDSGTVYGHSNAAGAAAVGAAFWGDTPRFGVDPPELEPFSSAGGTPILLSRSGRRIAEKIRPRPSFVAPDGGATTFFGDFFGTSAAAPHAAGVAALMLEANRRLAPREVVRLLRRSAIDMDDPATRRFDRGFDFSTGHGLIDARDAVERALDFD